MNNSKLWLVVKPTVGVPIFLAAVAIGSFAVHVAVLTNTGWVSNFLKGDDIMSAAIAGERTTATAKVVLDEAIAGAQEATVTLPDGRVATVVFRDAQAPQTAVAPTAE